MKDKWKFDGIDIYVAYGVVIQSGTDDFLGYPKRKESTSKNWLDENGLDIDLSHPTFEEKEVKLKCALIANNSDDFWAQYKAFFTAISIPGRRVFWTASLIGRTFNVYYKSCSGFKKLTKMLSGKIVSEFELILNSEI